MLWGFLYAAAVIDWRTLKIPNWLTIPGILLGLIQQGGFGLEGFLLALFLASGLALAGVWGGGDAKLLMMVGAFLGPWNFYSVFVLVLFLAAAVSFLRACRQKQIKEWIYGGTKGMSPFPLAPLVLLAAFLVGGVPW